MIPRASVKSSTNSTAPGSAVKKKITFHTDQLPPIADGRNSILTNAGALGGKNALGGSVQLQKTGATLQIGESTDAASRAANATSGLKQPTMVTLKASSK